MKTFGDGEYLYLQVTHERSIHLLTYSRMSGILVLGSTCRTDGIVASDATFPPRMRPRTMR
jgi:hypothetical protein